MAPPPKKVRCLRCHGEFKVSALRFWAGGPFICGKCVVERWDREKGDELRKDSI